MMEKLTTYERGIVGHCLQSPEMCNVVLATVDSWVPVDPLLKTIWSHIRKGDKDLVKSTIELRGQVESGLLTDLVTDWEMMTPGPIQKWVLAWAREYREVRAAHYDYPGRIKSGQTIDQIISDLGEISRMGQVAKAESVKDIAYESMSTYDKMRAAVVKTGFKNFDGIIQLRKKNLLVIAARPGQGKSTYCLNVMHGIAAHSKCLFFSFEMSKTELVEKLIFLHHKRQPENYEDYVKMASKFMASKESENIFILEHHGLSIPEIELEIISENPAVVFIDQLDCLPVDKGEKRHDLRIGENVIELKKLAIKHNVPVYLIHQLNRAADNATDGKLSYLKDSAIVEQKADVVGYLIPDDANEILKLSIVKNRMGGTGSIDMFFDKKISRLAERTTI
jgi:replicative DNA helicase